MGSKVLQKLWHAPPMSMVAFLSSSGDPRNNGGQAKIVYTIWKRYKSRGTAVELRGPLWKTNHDATPSSVKNTVQARLCR